MRRLVWIIVALLLLGLWQWSQPRVREKTVDVPTVAQASAIATDEATASSLRRDDIRLKQYPPFLPAEAHDVLRRIAQGGPFEYRQDGGVFQNRERRLPPQPRGYYREYTVQTPGSDDRGARRIITGGEPPREYWYTDDHYRSFRPFEVSP